MEQTKTHGKRASGAELGNKMRAMAALIIFLALATIVLFALTMTFAFRPARIANAEIMENLYQRNFYDLSDTMSDVEAGLDKMMVAKGKKLQRELSDRIWRDTGAAAVYLDGLPVDHHSIESTYRLVNQLGDYVYVLSRQLDDRDMTESERANIEGMYLRAAAVNRALGELRAKIGEYRFVEHLDYARIAAGEDYVGGAISGANEGEMPALVYDGPFSDALINPDYSGLDVLEEYSEERALARAETWFGPARSAGKTDSQPQCWQIETADGYLLLSVRGGLPLAYESECVPDGAELQGEEAAAAAEAWAAQVFGKAFVSVWLQAEGTTALVNLAPVENGVAYYTELVKVRINLADGSVCGVSAAAYLGNLSGHRSFRARIDVDQAQSAVNQKLNPAFVRLAAVPRSNGTQACAYEFRGSLNGKTYLSYVDAESGEEIILMRVLETETGTLIQ